MDTLSLAVRLTLDMARPRRSRARDLELALQADYFR